MKKIIFISLIILLSLSAIGITNAQACESNNDCSSSGVCIGGECIEPLPVPDTTPEGVSTKELIEAKLDATATMYAGYAPVTEESGIIDIIARIVKTILSLLGILVLIMIIISGFQWMTAGGNEETIGKAKKNITNAIIGLAIVISSYSLASFVTYILMVV